MPGRPPAPPAAGRVSSTAPRSPRRPRGSAARRTRPASAALENGHALLPEGRLRLPTVLCPRQLPGLLLLVAIAVAQRHLLDQVEAALGGADGKRALRRYLPRDRLRLRQQPVARVDAGDGADPVQLRGRHAAR